MSAQTIVFLATGTIQTYTAETAGTYVIEAAGAQGGAGAKGAWVSGMFHLQQGDRLKIVAGRRGISMPPQPPLAGRGGDSLVWTGPTDLPQAIRLMISARGGHDRIAHQSFAAPGDGVVPFDGISFNDREADQDTANALGTQWTKGADGAPSRPAAGAARTDRCGYNAGAFRACKPGVQEGDGLVSITLVVLPTSSGAPAGGFDGEPLPAGDDVASPPSSTILPEVTPRPSSWASFFHRRRPPGDA